MDSVAIRVFTFAILPVIIAAGHLALDSSSRTRERRLEILLLYLFGIGVAGSGIGGFFGHVFISDPVAESIGWPTGNPFQLEVGVANLAVGILGVVAMGRRDGFCEATVIAATVFGVGATVVHVMAVVESGNLAPGNTIQNISNLLRPALLIAFLAASRRAERSPDSEAQTPGFERWREPRIRAAGLMTASVAAGFGAGFAIDLPLIGTVVGTLVGAGLAAVVLARASDEISVRRTDQQPNQDPAFFSKCPEDHPSERLISPLTVLIHLRQHQSGQRHADPYSRRGVLWAPRRKAGHLARGIHLQNRNSPPQLGPAGRCPFWPCRRVARADAPPQGHPPSPLAQLVILSVIPPGPTAPNQTALNGMPSQPELPRPYWTGLSGRLAVIS